MLSKKIVWRLNIIDLLLLAIIVLSICALIYKATWGSGEEYRTYEVSYVCENIPIEILNSLQEGMDCSDYDSGSDLGKFKRAEYTPIIEAAAAQNPAGTDDADNEEDDEDDEDNKPTPAPTKEPTHARAVLVTEAEGAKAEHGVKVDGVILLRALKLDLIVGDTVLNVYVSDVK